MVAYMRRHVFRRARWCASTSFIEAINKRDSLEHVRLSRDSVD